MIKKKRFNPAILLLIFSISTLHIAAQQTHSFSAKESVEYALKHSVQVRNALLDITIRQQGNREITAAAYPQISGSSSITDYIRLPVSLVPGEFFGQAAGTYIPVRFGTKYNATYALNVRQIIFDGQVFVGLQARAASVVFAQQTVEATQEQIKANVYKIYYQLVVARNQIKLIDANIARAEKLLHDTKELYKNGFQEKLDVDKVNVSLSNLRTSRTTVENQLQTGYIGLKFLMGMPVKEDLVLTDSLSDADLKSNLVNDLNFKYDDRIEYRLQQTAARLGEYNVKRYRKSYLPSLSVNAGYAGNAQRNKFTIFKTNERWFRQSFVSVNLDIPIFDGFAKAARVQQARLQLMQTQNNITDLKNSIDNDVQTASIQIKNALTTLDEQKNNIALAEQVYNQTKLKYEQGLGSNLEVTNAETDLITAQNSYYSAIYDAIIARIDYLKAVGKL
ncbi:MAG TPA: TolC family protein [Chitinophagaceae bacterium]|nr:TolC family protein [Chitinophagaceae bacterium]